ncbi:MAG: DUF4232 domain-containing protein [Acidobacteriota bacterium]|nr:DUF4232 domain-containing protein [Acidobacteriota bacterium]
MTNGRGWMAALGVGLAAALSACGSSHGAATGSVTPTSGAPAPSVSNSTTTLAAPSSTAAPTTTTTAPGPSICPTSALTGTLTSPNGAAGSVYYHLVLTNQSSTACLLQGYPGVSFVTGSQGQQVGAPAERAPGSAAQLVVAPGGTAYSVLQITEAGNYASSCGITPTDGLRVYPPNQTAALLVPHTDNGCSNATDITLRVGPLQTGS